MKKNRGYGILSALLLIFLLIGCGEQKADTLALSVGGQETIAVTTEERASEESEWTQEKIKSVFFKNYSMSKGMEFVDCEVISDGASERVGAILLQETDTGMAEVAFMDAEGYFQKIGLAAKAAEEPEFTYVGNGIVSVQLLTDEGEPYTCEITFTQKDNEIKYVRKDSR